MVEQAIVESSSDEENKYLDLIIETSLKNPRPQSKDKPSKGNYKMNLSADLMRNGIFCAVLSPR